MIELTTLGCSGSYGAPPGGACSGYLVQTADATLWVDCGNGTLVNLQRHVGIEDIDAVVITHAHPDHCVDVYGLHVAARYGLERTGLPVFAAEGVEERMAPLVGSDWGDAFDWSTVRDGDAIKVGSTGVRFSQTDHPLPTLAVEVASGDKRLVYTSDTGPGWSAAVFGDRPDLLLSEATYVHDDIRAPIHLSARQAGEMACAVGARRLVLTHLWPTVDPLASLREGSEAFGDHVSLAAANATLRI
jgi:ribonuclease BN (tRNA processing enzyme)